MLYCHPGVLKHLPYVLLIIATFAFWIQKGNLFTCESSEIYALVTGNGERMVNC